MPIRHRKQSSVPDGGDANLVRPSDWNDTHTFPFRIVTAGETLASDDPIGASITTAQTFPMPAVVNAGDQFFLRNNSDSTALASINPGASRQIQGCPVADTLTLAPGEQAALYARTSTFFELLTPGAVGPPGASGLATPAGSDRQLQFNNAGALGGSSNVRLGASSDNLELGNFFDQAAVSIPAAPAAGFGRWFSRSRAGRVLPHYMGPAGVDVALQPSLFGNSVIMWLPSTGTTVAINFGEAWTSRNSGTGAAQAHPTRASTNALASLKRATFSTGTTATGSSGIQSTNTVCWRGNAAGLGGWFYFSRFAVETFRSDIQLLIGLSALNAVLAGEPSAQNNTVGIGKDSTDTNWFLIARDGSAVTKTPTGLAVAAGTILDFMMFAAPNSSSVTCRLVNAVDGTVYVDNVALTTNLPVATTFLNAHAQIRSTTGTTAALLALNRIYVETDL